MSEFKKKIASKTPNDNLPDLKSLMGTDVGENGAGEFLVVNVKSVTPDPEQPRKFFDLEEIDSLAQSIIRNGQLQPILVKPLSDGIYTIIAGERRWRAISSISDDAEINIVIRQGENDPISTLLMQLDENNSRVDVSTIENATAIKKVVDLCKSEGKKQADAALILGISKSNLSKTLSIVNAPIFITNLSANEEIQDIETLYSLTKAYAIDEEAVKKLVDKWRSDELAVNIRKAAQDLLLLLKSPDPINDLKDDKGKAEKDITEKGEGVSQEKNKNIFISRVVDSINVEKSEEGVVLFVECDGEVINLNLSDAVFDSLVSGLKFS